MALLPDWALWSSRAGTRAFLVLLPSDFLLPPSSSLPAAGHPRQPHLSSSAGNRSHGCSFFPAGRHVMWPWRRGPCPGDAVGSPRAGVKGEWPPHLAWPPRALHRCRFAVCPRRIACRMPGWPSLTPWSVLFQTGTVSCPQRPCSAERGLGQCHLVFLLHLLDMG